MNKELILKYKTEFDHCLNGGKILGKLYETSKWENLSLEVFEFRVNMYSIIINDKYVEFRKALAEGKTIQFKDLTEAWNDLKDPKFKAEPRHYRIKPEEPQFKVGDFVRDKTDNITYKLLDLELKSNEYFARTSDGTELWLDEVDNLVKWEPQVGELCWFTDTDSNVSVLAIFKGISEYRTFIIKDNARYDLCEPFLNSKPSWFKD